VVDREGAAMQRTKNTVRSAVLAGILAAATMAISSRVGSGRTRDADNLHPAVDFSGSNWEVIREQDESKSSGVIVIGAEATSSDLQELLSDKRIRSSIGTGYIRAIDMNSSGVAIKSAAEIFHRLSGLKELRLGGPVIVNDTFAEAYPWYGTTNGIAPNHGEGAKTSVDIDAALRTIAKINGVEVLRVGGRTLTDAGIEALRGLKSLRLLHIGIAKHFTGESLSELRECKQLTSLVIPATDLTDAGMENLKYFPQLEELSIGFVQSPSPLEVTAKQSSITTDGLEQLKGLRNLRRLQLCGFDAALKQTATIEVLAKLEVLDLADVPALFSKGAIVPRSLQHLRKVAIHNTATPKEALSQLRELNRLEELTLQNTELDDGGARYLCGLTSLKQLQLIDQDAVAEYGTGENGGDKFALEGSGLPAALKTMIKLDELVCDNCAIGDNAMPSVGSLTQLKRLHLSGTLVRASGMQYVDRLTRLESLDLNEGRDANISINDDGLRRLKGLTRLQDLDLGGTEVTDAGLATLRSFTELRTLWLPSRISDDGIEHLRQLKKLEVIRGAGKITRKGLQMLADNLPKLRVAEISDQGVIEDGRLFLNP
jgi:Leucine-rich repeat (LRR) protein